MSLEEANNWYNVGNGKSVTLNAENIDLDFVNIKARKWSKGEYYGVQTLFSSKDGRVLGNITIQYLGNNQVRILPDIYDFEQHGKFMDSFIRNIATVIGGWVAGEGKQFQINFKGINN